MKSFCIVCLCTCLLHMAAGGAGSWYFLNKFSYMPDKGPYAVGGFVVGVMCMWFLFFLIQILWWAYEEIQYERQQH